MIALYTLSIMPETGKNTKSRMVRIVVSDDVWNDFKLIHRNRYASGVLGDMVERAVMKARRTDLALTDDLVESAIEDAAALKDELEQLVERLERVRLDY